MTVLASVDSSTANIEEKVASQMPEPKGYSITWPNLDELSAIEQAAVALQRTEAMAKFVGGGVEAIMPVMDYLTREMHYTTEEAEAILVEAKLDLTEEMLIDEPEEPKERPADES